MGGGGGVAVDLTGGAATGGNLQSQTGDFTGGSMVMNNQSSNGALIAGVAGVLLVGAGVAFWMINK